MALRHQLQAAPTSIPEVDLQSKSTRQLAHMYYDSLVARGKAQDEMARRTWRDSNPAAMYSLHALWGGHAISWDEITRGACDSRVHLRHTRVGCPGAIESHLRVHVRI